jgi:hypothetical protein
MKQPEAASEDTYKVMQNLSHILTRTSVATFFGPNGGSTQGAVEVSSRYENDAKNFDHVSHFDFEILQMVASDGIAYRVGFMRGKLACTGNRSQY